MDHRIFYTVQQGRLGDVIPYYENGEFRPFYLNTGLGWCNVTTKDRLHFYNAFSTGIYGGTGSVIKVDGLYHMFYCKFSNYPYQRQWVCHATSEDFTSWTEHPEHTFMPDGDIYEMSDWRDPHVVWNEEEQCWWMLLAAQKRGKTMRKGCVGLCVSQDLIHWDYREPLYAPATSQSANECPDIFKWGDWWYLTFSVFTDRFQTLYRMSKSMNGPWITPEVDTFDTRCFYAAKHGTDGENHYMYGWNPTKDETPSGFNPKEDFGKDYASWDWGGTMIVHQLIQREDGTLCVKPPEAVDRALTEPVTPEIMPVNGEWQVTQDSASVSSPYAYASLLMNHVPPLCKLEMDVCFTEAPREFGVALQMDNDFAQGYYLTFEPYRSRVQYKTGIRMYEDGCKMFPYEVEQERPFRWEAGKNYHLRIFVQDSILLLYVDDAIALGTRMFNRKDGRFGLFVSEGSASFANIRLMTL